MRSTDHHTGLYCVRDKVAETCSPPFTALNDGVALRYYADYRTKLPPTVSPDDFDLLYIGEYNEFDGSIQSEVHPHTVSIGGRP